MSMCILLNADYTFLNLVHWKRAVCLMTKGKVEVIKDSQATVHNASGAELRIPAVMRLVKLIRTIYRAGVRSPSAMSWCGMVSGAPTAAARKTGCPSTTSSRDRAAERPPSITVWPPARAVI